MFESRTVTLAGALLLAFGIYLLVENNVSGSIKFLAEIDNLVEMTEASDYLIKIAAYAMVAIGTFIFLIGFCGCCGAIKESKCLLGLYMFFLGVVMLCEIAVSCIAIYFYTDAGRSASGWNDFLSTSELEYSSWVEENYTTDGNFRESVNQFQIQLQCCGWNGVEDYSNVTWDHVTGIVPSCCILTDDITDGSIRNLTYSQPMMLNSTACAQREAKAIHTSACNTELDEWLGANSVILIGSGLGIACLQILGLFFACCLCGAIP